MTTVWAVYFSGTGTTERTVTHIAGELARLLAAPCRSLDFTRPQVRQQELNFCQSDLVVLGTPVYAGRVPNVLLPFLREKVRGRGALAVPVVLFGNRNYDDALIELRDILQEDGFRCVAAGAAPSAPGHPPGGQYRFSAHAECPRRPAPWPCT